MFICENSSLNVFEFHIYIYLWCIFCSVNVPAPFVLFLLSTCKSWKITHWTLSFKNVTTQTKPEDSAVKAINISYSQRPPPSTIPPPTPTLALLYTRSRRRSVVKKKKSGLQKWHTPPRDDWCLRHQRGRQWQVKRRLTVRGDRTEHSAALAPRSRGGEGPGPLGASDGPAACCGLCLDHCLCWRCCSLD